MADLTPLDRLQPCLLDRLTDHQPDQQQEGRNERVVSLRQYRMYVLRDLGYLLNSPRRLPRESLESFPEVARSVLNYGLPNLCGVSIGSFKALQLEAELRDAIRLFEPRLLPRSLSVELTVTPDRPDNVLCLDIRGELWNQPVPDALDVMTELDLETGQFQMKDGGGG